MSAFTFSGPPSVRGSKLRSSDLESNTCESTLSASRGVELTRNWTSRSTFTCFLCLSSIGDKGDKSCQRTDCVKGVSIKE
ncbi:hypothetical protein CHS0354_035709, partial [Potamilus streckersoni]